MRWSAMHPVEVGRSRWGRPEGEPPAGPSPRVPRAASLCVGSGKGGAGKSVVSAALAALLAERGPTLLVDADLGVGNAHILQDVAPERTLVDVVEGTADVAGVRTACGPGLDLVAAGSGVPRMAALAPCELQLVAHGLAELERDYRFLLVDAGAGVSRQTMRFAEACDVVVVVTTPDLTAMTDAYAFLKVLDVRRPRARPLLVVNRAADLAQADRVHRRIADVCARFLGSAPLAAGWIPEDPAVTAAVDRRAPVVRHAPDAPAAEALAALGRRVLAALRDVPGGAGARMLAELETEPPARRSRGA